MVIEAGDSMYTLEEDMWTGWSWALASLKSYLETGEPISFEAWIERKAGQERD